ncbi:SMP-30/gluconolactonase/LRE family protein [Petropleomorpha daqingensis]|uniref:Sugar lactone lactonase YvrE n=1 Tax=Petropleomorpha daqingensis TaxID=2026353 RepID=A0A853CI53_9ACTN|nr:SMP-30/gluconolactonase/LRE family protein [Petropleomorpha daqingensis]NYJ07187.1 sugar lactone lactonase YvrE [Petropleomorpha daqingensis]
MTVSQTVVSIGHGFLEGPRWRDGRLYASDFFARTVLTFDGDGVRDVVCEVPGQPSGLGWSPDGVLHVVSMLDRRLLRLENGELTELADLSGLFPWHANDLIVDGSGRSYVGNFGWDEGTVDTIAATVIARVDPDGSVSTAATDLVFPNGMAITPDGATFLVAETFAARVTAFTIGDDGSLSDRRVWADFADGATFPTLTEAMASGAVLPDGIALHADGTLWVADAARQGVLRVAQGGEVLQRIGFGTRTAFAVAVGGPAADTLYACVAAPYRSANPSLDWQASLVRVDLDPVMADDAVWAGR